MTDTPPMIAKAREVAERLDGLSTCGCDEGEVCSASNEGATLLRELAQENGELERIALRLGTLGLNADMPADLASLCARLGAMGSYGHKPYPTHMINPDGREAAAAIEHLNTRVKSLEGALAEIADVWSLPAPGIPEGRKWHCQHEEWLSSAAIRARAALEGMQAEGMSSGSEG